MLSGTTNLGNAIQFAKNLARLEAAEHFLRSNNRHTEADAVWNAAQFLKSQQKSLLEAADEYVRRT